MKQYRVDWTDLAYGQAGFYARDLSHALEILERLSKGELLESDVFVWTTKHEDTYRYENLRELKDKPKEDN